MTTRLRRCSWVAAVLGWIGCSVDPASPQAIEPGDAALYAAYVQPYLEVRCATLDCHGVAGRPLRLYSELGLRREAGLRDAPIQDDRDPTPITTQELDDNRLAIAGIVAGTTDPASTLLLMKPLARGAGGMEHVGGAHWETRRDRGYRCLQGYLAGDLSEDVALACARALDDSLPEADTGLP